MTVSTTIHPASTCLQVYNNHSLFRDPNPIPIVIQNSILGCSLCFALNLKIYPKVDNNTYYTPPPPPPTQAPMAATGFPVNSTSQFYPPPMNSAFQTQSQPPPAAWSTGLCGCFDDVGNCCITCLCPCITFGQIAEIIDRGSTSCGASGALYTLILCLTGCQCIYSCFYRSKMREQYSLHESPCNDCLVHCCCETCALCQEYRELKTRGFDMNIGWHANMERQGRTGQPAMGMAPPMVQSAMSR